jgi:hypothetical protein
LGDLSIFDVGQLPYFDVYGAIDQNCMGGEYCAQRRYSGSG